MIDPLDHLEFRDGPHVGAGSGAGYTDRAPRHLWHPLAIDAPAQRCSRCGLERYGYPEDTTYRQRQRLGLRAGAEPSCLRGKAVAR